MKVEYDLVVIGAGASGIMAAITAKKLNNDISVCIVESNSSIGKKLRITEGGRCNFTNNNSIDVFFDNIVNNKKFLYSSLYNFTNDDMKKTIRELGLDYIIEKENDNKVYLKSNNAQDLIDAFERKLKNEYIDIFYNSRVIDIDLESQEKKIYTKDIIFYCKQVIVATGGLSYPQTGSDGSMFTLLSNKGYNIVKPVSALSTITVNEKWIRSIPGISMRDVEIKIIQKKKDKLKIIETILGDIIFTHTGIGGPVSMKVSSYINRKLNDTELILDLVPEITEDELYNICKKDSKKSILINLKNIFPSNFLKIIFEDIKNKKGIAENTLDDLSSSGNFSKSDFELLLKYTKKIKIIPVGLGKLDTATITSGGIDTKDINPNTMESKKHNNVYIVGEMIDVDALTGGYNLQIAFSTGVLAGQSCIERIKKEVL